MLDKDKWKLKYAIGFDEDTKTLEVSGAFDYTDCIHKEKITKNLLDKLEQEARNSLGVIALARLRLHL